MTPIEGEQGFELTPINFDRCHPRHLFFSLGRLALSCDPFQRGPKLRIGYL